VGKIDSHNTQLENGAEVLVVTADSLIAIAPDMSIVWQTPFASVKGVSF
jgi:hypothetical protein